MTTPKPTSAKYPQSDATPLRTRLVDAFEAVSLNLRRMEREAMDYVPPGEVRRRSLERW